MLGGAPLSAPWGQRSSSPARPSRVWQVKRHASPSKAGGGGQCSSWQPTAPAYLRAAPRGASSPPPSSLREAAAARAEGLHASSAAKDDDGWFEPFEPAIGLTPQELEERQAQRGKLAMLRSQREQAVTRETEALAREKRMYARALGKAASHQAIDQLRTERSCQRSSSAAANGSSPRHVPSRSWDLSANGGGALSASQRQQRMQELRMGGHLDDRYAGGHEDAENSPSDAMSGDAPYDEASATLAEAGGRLQQMNAQLHAASQRLLGGHDDDEERAGHQTRSSCSVGGGSSSVGRDRGAGAGGPLLGCGESALAGLSPSGMSMRSHHSAASGLSAGALASSLHAPPKVERLYSGVPIEQAPPTREAMLERALERGRAASARKAQETAAARRKADEQRLRKEHARMLGGAASGFAIEQLKRHGSPAKGAAPPSAAAREGGEGGSAARQDEPGVDDDSSAAKALAVAFGEALEGGGGGGGGEAGPASARRDGALQSGSERHAAYLGEQKRQAARLRASASGNVSASKPIAAFGRSASPAPRLERPASPARPLSPRMKAMTDRFYSSTTESARRAAEVSRELRTEVRRNASPSRGARPLLGGPLAASRALAEGLSPAEVYMRLAQGEGLPGGSGGGGGGGGSGGSRHSNASTGAGAVSARGAPKQRLPPQPEMNVTDAVCLIQRRTRGVLGRRRGMEQKAAYALQRVARRWIARRRRAKARREAKDRSRLYSGTSGAGHHSALRGRWAEKSAPVSSLPAQRSKAGPPSPRGRPTHQKLYENAEEKQDKMRQLKQEQSEKDDKAHVATCTFSPAQITKSQKYKDVKPRIDASWAKPPPRPLSPRSGNGRGSKAEHEEEPTKGKVPPSQEGVGPPPPVDVSDVQPGDDEWTTVATTALHGGSALRR